jgi:hypothetical protein
MILLHLLLLLPPPPPPIHGGDPWLLSPERNSPSLSLSLFTFFEIGTVYLFIYILFLLCLQKTSC